MSQTRVTKDGNIKYALSATDRFVGSRHESVLGVRRAKSVQKTVA